VSLQFSIGGVFKTVSTAFANVFKVRVGGAWKDVSRVRIFKTVAGMQGWRDVWARATVPSPPPPPPAPPPPPPPPPVVITVTLNAPTAYGSKIGAGTVTTSFSTVATASGGTGPYSYHWEVTSWDYTAPPTATAPDANTSKFTQTGMFSDDSAHATFRVTAVDTIGNIGTAHVDCQWDTFSRFGGGGGDLP
jgi:hypothetical protein